MTDPWSRAFQIDSMSAACQFVETIWNEEHVPPSRLHGRGPQPRDLSGAPKWSGQFSSYIFANPNEVEAVTSTERGVHDTRWQYRYPLWHALQVIDRKPNDQWTKGVPRRPFHPTPVSVLRAMALDNFDPAKVRLRFADGSRVPADMAELFCIGAARKLRGTYTETYVSWVARSESQQNADNAA
jgi:hypothetical protein